MRTITLDFSIFNILKIIEKVYAHIFFLFFVAQILSPYVGGYTIYMEILIAILNPFFLNWLFKQKIKLKYFIIFVGILFIFAIGKPVEAIKFMVTAIGVMFLFYAHDRKLFYLKFYLYLSITIAILQFIFLFINPSFAKLIGPTNIAKTIWGPYATPTFTNFYPIFFILRVSGLSREGGFFASLIIVYILFVFIKKNRFKNKVSFTDKFILFTGYLISFSKMSLLLFPLLIIEKIRKIIDIFTPLLVTLVFVLFMIIFWNLNKEFLMSPHNITFLHRFAAYPILLDIDLKQFLFGVENPYNLDSSLSNYAFSIYDKLAGFGGFILHNGMINIIILLILSILFGLKGSGMAILLIATMNVQPDTNQNFVTLVYFLVLKYYSYTKVIWRKYANN